jgi:hypothetical protein
MFAALLRREKRRSSEGFREQGSGALQGTAHKKIMPLQKAARTRNSWSSSGESLFA